MTLKEVEELKISEFENGNFFQKYLFKYKNDTYNGVIYNGDPNGIGTFIWLFKDDYYEGFDADYKECELIAL